MHTNSTTNDSSNELAILARLLGNEHGQLPTTLARYILNIHFSDEDKARMHELTQSNQADRLSATEKEELSAYAKAGTLLSILKSKPAILFA